MPRAIPGTQEAQEKFVEWISMRDFNVLVFSNGTPKDPLGRRSGQGDKQTLNPPNLPHPAPKP